MTRKKLIILIIIIAGLLLIIFLLNKKENKEDEFSTPSVAIPEGNSENDIIDNEIIYDELLDEMEDDLDE